MSRDYFTTGTSSGFGRATASVALERGHKVVMTARNPEAVAKLVEQYPEHAFAQRLDVTSAAEREQAIKAAAERFGRIDVLANIAGQGSLGALEEFSSGHSADSLRSTSLAFWS